MPWPYTKFRSCQFIKHVVESAHIGGFLCKLDRSFRVDPNIVESMSLPLTTPNSIELVDKCGSRCRIDTHIRRLPQELHTTQFQSFHFFPNGHRIQSQIAGCGSSGVASRTTPVDVNIELEDTVAGCSTPSQLPCIDYQALSGHPRQGMRTSTTLVPAWLHRPKLMHP